LSKYFSQETAKATRIKPVEGKKSDSAHPSIMPTGEFESLGGEEKKIYELIVKRFISCFCENALIENKIITAETIDEKTKEKLIFKERGMQIIEPEWTEIYNPKLVERELKDMNGKADILKVEIEKDETKPSKRYSPASIITQLEHLGLGTKSTRSAIIETLYDRGYIISIENKAIKATPLGINLIDTLEKYSPIIIDEKLTRNIEKDMEHLQESKKDLDKKEKIILEKAKSSLIDISADFKSKELQIGRELIKAEQEHWKEQNKQNELSECQSCKKGNLIIKFSPKNKKYFIACTNYPNCKQTYSLPPYGLIKKLDNNKVCDKCSFPLLMSIQKGKRPWIFFFNPNCESRKNNNIQQENPAENLEEESRE
jgi:DNA topoisomerase-1